MSSFDDPAFYGDQWAGVYDTWYAPDPTAAVEFLVDLAGDEKVLELAIGTGRVGLPLAARGIEVHGLDASSAMIEQLRAKPGGHAIEVTIGDMAHFAVPGQFRLVYLVLYGIFALLTQDRQTACFRSVARVLEPGGVFVIECSVPDIARFRNGQAAHVVQVTEDTAVLQLSRYDAVTQRINTQSLMFDQRGMHMLPNPMRYAWPAELDEMAGKAGLRLKERYGDWDRQRFTATSTKHISVYEHSVNV
jgi:SAM-dependent methyltransferase